MSPVVFDHTSPGHVTTPNARAGHRDLLSVDSSRRPTRCSSQSSRHASPPTGVAPRQSDGQDRPSRPRILLVEDFEGILMLMRASLEPNFDVLDAANCVDALSILSRTEAPIDLAVVDVILPGMSSLAFLRALEGYQPSMRILLTSGYSESELERRGVARTGLPFLAKPFAPSDLVWTIAQVLSMPPQGLANPLGNPEFGT